MVKLENDCWSKNKLHIVVLYRDPIEMKFFYDLMTFNYELALKPPPPPLDLHAKYKVAHRHMISKLLHRPLTWGLITIGHS